MKTNYYKLRKFIYSLALAGALPSMAGVVAHFPMELNGKLIKEVISNKDYLVKGQFGEACTGAIGQGLMMDGYSTYIDAKLNNIFEKGSPSMTASVWVALPCYPIVKLDERTKEKSTIVSCLDESDKKGFGFYVGMDGKVEFKLFAGGWPVSVESNRSLPTYSFTNLTAVLNGADKTLKLYFNGEEVGSTRCNGTMDPFTGQLRFGFGPSDNKMNNLFNLQSFAGIIDEFKVWDEPLSPSAIAGMKAESECDLSIPESRFAEQKLRPRFHGMPGAGWTNESHGLIKSGGRYHVFFQKNANGPYMARLHWGHISSDNLYDWREDKIAFGPDEDYDFKGCWSGAVFSDDEITGGKPAAIYTAVDYGRATIAMASPEDDQLLNWKKNNKNPLIAGRPQGLSDDFRDCFFFRNGDKAYIIVGSSKNDKGVTTLHRYSNGNWTNDGSVFFAAKDKATEGRFWEMPNVTKMADGKWLFTATPLDMNGGVRLLYWTGDINADGTFAPDAKSATPRGVELISKEGYGLLSPSIYQEEGKTIAMGIVPDKLPGSINHQLGWAHLYSLPREWSIDAEGDLIQKPYEGLKAMRTNVAITKQAFTLNGSEELAPVSGRQAELKLTATPDSAEFGFNIFKNHSGEAKVSINGTTSEFRVDLTNLKRYDNDGWSYGGVYSTTLPQLLKKGEEVTLHLFIDGSILDIFINDKWATSIRVFPTEADADGIEAFSTTPTAVKSLEAWTLDSKSTAGIPDTISADNLSASGNNVYSIDGTLVKQNVDVSNPLEDLPKGVYIFNGKRMVK